MVKSKSVGYVLTTIFILLSIADSFAQPLNRSPKTASLSAPSDLVVTSEGDNYTLFVADAESGHIYTYVWQKYLPKTPGIPDSVDFKKFSALELRNQPAEFRSPSALAYREGKLFVCDANAAALYQIKLDTLEVSTLLKGADLETPTTMAVSAEGLIAVSGKDSKHIVIYDLNNGKHYLLEPQDNTEEPTRLAFSGSDLVVLNEEGRIFKVYINLSSAEPLRPHLVEVEIPIPLKLRLDFAGIEDFATINGIFYVADKQNMLAFAKDFQLDEKPLEAKPQSRHVTPSRLQVTDNFLFVGDAEHKLVWIWLRPTILDVRLEGSGEESSRTLAEIYYYMYQKNLLPERVYTAPRDYDTLEQLLVETRALVAPLSVANALRERTRLSDIMYRLNPQLFNNTASREADNFLKIKVRKGEQVTIPGARVQQYLTPISVTLSGKTTLQYLQENMSAENLRERYGSVEYLARLNKINVASPDAKNILTQNSGQLILPFFRWRLTILANVADVNDDTDLSLINTLRANYKGVRILKREEAVTRAASANFLSAVRTPQLEVVKQNRAALIKDIHFPTDLADMPELRIGVVEDKDRVYQQHPDFIGSDGLSAWLPSQAPVNAEGDDAGGESAGNTPPPATPVPVATAAVPVEARKVIPKEQKPLDTDHGTHIAGLLAARRNGLTPGLLPTVKLLLVDASSPTSIYDSISDAYVSRDTYIFNLSIEFCPPGTSNAAKKPCSPDDYQDILNKIHTGWEKCLFVVAAGNEDKNFWKTAPAGPPVSWMASVPALNKNVIVVSAAAPVGNPAFASGVSQKIMEGANYGKKFVHLIAPGLGIYSTVRESAYAEGSGTSQATPQVTAAAALLLNQDQQLLPSVIKARLIYTADWYQDLLNEVWGGFLNAERATWEINRNYFRTQTDKDQITSITLLVNNKATLDNTNSIRVSRAKEDDPNAEELKDVLNLRIPFSKILRIRFQDEDPRKRFQVIYLDGKKLRILRDAMLEGSIKCDTYQGYDAAKQSFEAGKKCSADGGDYPNGVRLSQIYDYVGKIPSAVEY